MNSMNAAATITPAPAIVTEGKEGITMESSFVLTSSAVAILDGKVKSSAARKYAAEYTREILSSVAVAACRNETIDFAPVAAVARVLAVALSGKVDGVEINYTPVPAPVLYAACVSFNVKGLYTVKGCGFIRNFARVSNYSATEKVAAAVLPSDAYKATKKSTPAPKTRSPFEEFAARMYSMEKAANKASTPVDQMPSFPAFGEWLTEEKTSMLKVAAAAMNIPC